MIRIVYNNNTNEIQWMVRNEVPFLQFEKLQQIPGVKHGFSTRHGGVSTGIYSSMNLSFTRGDDEATVQENFTRICNAIGVSKEKVVCSKQTHTTNVLKVTEAYIGNGVLKENVLEDIDGLVTDIPGVCLCTSYADCVPLYFVDPVKKVIGLSHSGWRGTVGKIGQVTIQKMVTEYGCCVTDIIAAVGPSICQACYEVSADVIEQFQRTFDKKHWEQLFYATHTDKYQLNLWEANKIILLEAGISKEHIAVTNVCTACNSDDLFSHRITNGERGNLAAFLALEEK